MKNEINCMILWHYFDADGKLINASGTNLVGSMMHLSERLGEAYIECNKNRAAKRPYTIPVQVIPAMDTGSS